IKNMNSFRSIQRAIESEVARQISLVEAGERITQETRLWDEVSQTTRSMRSKEEAHDYRYFTDPDLRPLHISPEWVDSLRATLPELPRQRYERLLKGFGLNEYDANLLVENKELGDFFELAVEHTTCYKGVANWLMGDITAYLKE